MRVRTPLLLLAVAIGGLALPLDSGPSRDSTDLEVPMINNVDDGFNLTDDAPSPTWGTRFTCGRYAFEDGWVQDFYSQVWANRPRAEFNCHALKYEFTHAEKKHQYGKMVALKVDRGCSCLLYVDGCDPIRGDHEIWKGWDGWDSWHYPTRVFKGWWCYEVY